MTDERTITITYKKSKLPADVRGGIIEKEPGAYYIAINEDISPDEQAAAFLHECLHVYHNDFSSGKTVRQIESERHRELKRVLCLLDNQE